MIEQRESRNSSKDDDDDERLDVVGLDDCNASLPGIVLLVLFSGRILSDPYLSPYKSAYFPSVTLA